MQDIQPIVIPTLSKTKISSKLSYPVGAEQISVALASAPQLAEIKLHFYLSRFDGNLANKGRRDHEFLRVEYTNDSAPAQEWPIIDLYGCPLQGGWEIIVQPVPRAMRSRVKQYIVDSALQQIARWLTERAGLTNQGSDVLAFFHDNENDEFIPRKLTRLAPLPTRSV